MATPFVTCRTCKSLKGRDDICPVCCARLRPQTMKVHKSQPISLTSAHFFHAAASTTTSISRGDYR